MIRSSTAGPSSHSHVYETQVFGCENSDGVRVISFRGSSSARDWITDATFSTIRRSDSPGRWHRGMSKAFDGVEWLIENWLSWRVDPLHKIVLVGHSLGGGIATIAASQFSDFSLITFGAPRVCTYQAAEWLKTRLVTRRAVRLVKYGDPVPGLPLPIWLQLGIYTHAIPPTMIGAKDHDLALDHPVAGYVEDLRRE